MENTSPKNFMISHIGESFDESFSILNPASRIDHLNPNSLDGSPKRFGKNKIKITG